MNDKSKKYYEYLKGTGVKVAPTYESFESTLQDDVKRQKYYDYLSTQDVNIPDSFESFSSTLVKKKDQSQAEVSTKDSQAPVEPLSESGEEDVTKEISSLNNTKKPTNYTVDGVEYTAPEFRKFAFDTDFINEVRDGKKNISIDNDEDMQALFQSQVESGSQLGDVWDYLKAGSYDVASGFVGIPNYINTILEEVTGLEVNNIGDAVSKMQSEEFAKKAEEAIKETRQYEEDFISSVSEGNWDDAGYQLLNTFARSAPLMTTAALTGGGSGAAIMTLMPLTTSAEFARTNISEDESLKNLSTPDKLIRSGLHGGFEAIGEGIGNIAVSKTFNLIKGGIKPIIKNIAKEKGKDAAKEVAESTAKNWAKETGKVLGINVASEGGGEGITELGQNLTDVFMGVADYTPQEIARNVLNASALGAVMGGGMTATGASVNKIGNEASKYISKNKEILIKEVENKVESGEISLAKGDEAISDLEANSKIQEVPEENKAEAVKTQKKLDETLANKSEASDAFKVLYDGDINKYENKLLELAGYKKNEEGDIVKISTPDSKKEPVGNESKPKQSSADGDVVGQTKEVKDDVQKQQKEDNPEKKQVETTKKDEQKTKGKKVLGKESISEKKTENDIIIYKGSTGKVNQDGSKKTRHPNIKGKFYSKDEKTAGRYGDVSKLTIPKGTTVEEIKIEPKGLTPNEYNKAEEDAVNKSKAQVVILNTIENVQKKGKKTEDQIIVKDDSIFKENDVKKENIEGKKLRGVAESVGNTFTKVKDRIKTNPENYYTPQNQKEIISEMENLSDEELISKMSDSGLNIMQEGNDNSSVLAAIETINRRMANDKPIDDIVEKFAKEGTRMGQLIAQFAALNSSTPFGVMSTVNKVAEKQGKILSKEQKKNLQDLANKMLKSNAKLNQHIKSKGGLATKEDIKELNKLKKEAEKETKEFYKYAAPFTPLKWVDMLEMTLQGNLLTPLSQATNIGANIAQQALLTPVNTISDISDVVVSLFTGKRVNSFDPRKYGYAWLGRWQGIKDSFNTLIHGDNSYAKGEVKRSFRPFTSAIQSLTETKLGDWFGVKRGLIPKTVSKEGMVKLKKANKLQEEGKVDEADKIREEVIKESKISVNDRAKKIFEATLGVPAESMFRLLSLGDKPFYMGEVYKERFISGKKKGLKGDALRNFVVMPDAATLEKVNEEAKEVVFMEDGVLAETAQKTTSGIRSALRGVPVIGDVLSFLFRTAVPYVKTPSNIISQTIDFVVPPVALGKALYNYKKGNQKLGNKNLGIAITGIMIGQAAGVLIANGLLSSALDWSDEDDKNIKFKVFAPNSLNISGLKRLLNGDDPSFKAGDTTIDITKLGIVGASFMVRANRKTNEDEEEKSLLGELNEIIGLSSLPEVVKQSFEQSFLAGTSSLLEMLKGGEYQTKRWLKQTLSATGAIMLPNTLAAINRATDTYLYDTRTDEMHEMLEATIKDRLGFAMPDDFNDFPVRVDMWGDPIKRTPDGKNPYAHQFLDITKSRTIPNDPLSLELYNLYSLTHNKKIIPNLPKRRVRDVTIPKNKEGNIIYNDYAAKIQKLKREVADKEFNKSSYKKSSIENKVKRMSEALSNYSKSSKYNKYIKEVIDKVKALDKTDK